MAERKKINIRRTVHQAVRVSLTENLKCSTLAADHH